MSAHDSEGIIAKSPDYEALKAIIGGDRIPLRDPFPFMPNEYGTHPHWLVDLDRIDNNKIPKLFESSHQLLTAVLGSGAKQYNISGNYYCVFPYEVITLVKGKSEATQRVKELMDTAALNQTIAEFIPIHFNQWITGNKKPDRISEKEVEIKPSVYEFYLGDINLNLLDQVHELDFQSSSKAKDI